MKSIFLKNLNVKELNLNIGRGRALPLGADKIGNGVNFSVFSGSCSKIKLVIFTEKSQTPLIELEFDPIKNATGNVWHMYIEGLPDNFEYGYRVYGEKNPQKGLFFNSDKIIFDPYSLSLSGCDDWGCVECNNIGNTKYVKRSYIPDTEFDWGNDSQLNIPYREIIIYELHVRGFTMDKSSNVTNPGTYDGIIEKIPYLKSLGVNAVELMPINEFDENENINLNPETGEKLKNFWGYSTLGFFAPKASYSSEKGNQVIEFKKMVKLFHDAGIEVILDIVFNHTGEGKDPDLLYSFKGLDANSYYMIDKGHFMNFSGCGNTFNCNHPVGRNFIMDVLRYWVIHMHVDGFRFDLASILGRDEFGNVMPNPPILDHIARDPVLAKTKIIAEAWDAAGLYQVGSFPGSRWAEWNGKYRDCIRRLVKGEYGMISEFIHRLKGSPDLYKTSNREPYHSINFVCSHDGFTLNDLVSYNEKHNFQNGENNRDGDNSNFSFNYGVEGPTDSAVINEFRKRQIKNFFTILLLSQGTPMICAGDEFLRTQFGNNNAYCQDNEISWLNWEKLNINNDIFEFVKKLIAFRKSTSMIGIESFSELEDDIKVSIHGVKLNKPDFSYYSRTIALEFEDFSLKLYNPYKRIYIIFNFWESYLEFELPRPNMNLLIDTSLKDSFCSGLSVSMKYMLSAPFSIQVLVENKEKDMT